MMVKLKRWLIGLLYSFVGFVNCIFCIASVIHFIDMTHSTGMEFIKSFLGFVCGIILVICLPYWFSSIIKDAWKK